MSRRPIPCVVLSCLAAASVVAAGLAGSASASAPVQSPVAVPAVPVELTFTVALPYDRGALQDVARQISTPGSSRYREFLTLKQAAARYGATGQQRNRLKAWAEGNGMRVHFDATGLTARVTGPTETWQDIYRAEVTVEPGGPAPRMATYFFASGEAFVNTVPKTLAGVVAGIIPVFNDLLPAPRAGFDPPRNTGEPFGPGEECVTGETKGIPNLDLTYSPRQLHTPYGTAALHRAGYQGKGARLAIVALGQSYLPGAADGAARCFGYRAPTVRTTGAFGMPDSPVQTQGFEGVESDLDLQTAAAVLPKADRIGFVEAAGGASFILSLVDGFTAAY